MDKPMKTYSEFIIESDKKKCPPNYKWDKEQMMCVPVEDKEENSTKDASPENGPGYDTWGSSGYDGGYAIATNRL